MASDFVLFTSNAATHLKENVMRLIASILACQLFCLVANVQSAGRESETALFSTRHTNATELLEGVKDPEIVQFVAQILQRQHYLRMPINDDVSAKFLDRYLDSLDSLHIYFTQSDIHEFEKYRFRLDDLTVKEGNTAAARVIFSRWRQHLEQQNEYVQGLLKKGEFDFTGDDRFVIDRKKLPRPRDLDEARRCAEMRDSRNHVDYREKQTQRAAHVSSLWS